MSPQGILWQFRQSKSSNHRQETAKFLGLGRSIPRSSKGKMGESVLERSVILEAPRIYNRMQQRMRNARSSRPWAGSSQDWSSVYSQWMVHGQKPGCGPCMCPRSRGQDLGVSITAMPDKMRDDTTLLHFAWSQPLLLIMQSKQPTSFFLFFS